MAKNKRIYFRCDEKQKEKFFKAAKKEKMTVSQYILYLLDQNWTEEKKEEK